MLTAPRLPFAMGADAPGLARLAAVHPQYQTPHAAILVTFLLAIVYLWGRSFEQLVESYILGSWPFYVLTAWGFFRLRRRQPDLPRPFRVPGYPLVPGFFLVAAAAMVLNGFAADPFGAIKGSWVMAVGIPVWFLVRPRSAGGPPSATVPP
jgi:APA family basic amino acid/polyamine antiporter